MVFEPTHIVPQGGVPVWSTPDGSQPPVGNLAPGTEVQAGEQRGEWLHLTAVNGWTGWAEGARLVTKSVAGSFGVPPALAGADGTVLIAGEELQLATVGQRAGARIIDLVLFLIVMFVVGIAFGGAFLEDTDPRPNQVEYEVTNPLALVVLNLASWFIYEVPFLASAGATPGKRMVGIKVRARDGSAALGGGRAARRWLVPAGGSIIPLVGWIWSLVAFLSAMSDPLRRGWHDKFADTLVVRVR